jgi:hypothetical protein
MVNKNDDNKNSNSDVIVIINKIKIISGVDAVGVLPQRDAAIMLIWLISI